MAERKVADLEKLELDYRTGLRTFREMARTHGISGPRIKQIADREGWTRDLGAKIRQTAAAKLALPPPSEAKLETEQAIVQAGADNIVAMVLSHRRDAQRARALAVAMMEEVEVMTRAPLVLRDLQDTLRKCRAGEEIPADVMARADQLLGQALTVDSRAGTLKTLSETLIKVVAIERDTFHIDGGGDKPAGADASVLAGAMSAHAQRMEQAFAKATAAITAGAHAE